MSDTDAKYEALRLLLAGAGSAAPADLAAVLTAVCKAVGLSGAALVREPEEEAPLATAGTEAAQSTLRHYATGLWNQLRHDHQVESAYLQLRSEGELQSLFAYPLYAGGEISGAVLGLATGARNLSLEEDFLFALTTGLRYALAVGDTEAVKPEAEGETADVARKARLAAILETAIAVNHEVNNPLTAVLGNAQLLLLQAEQLDPQMRKRLEDIERSALRIKEVTQRLLNQDGLKTTDYPGGLRMLDLSDSDEPPSSDEPE